MTARRLLVVALGFGMWGWGFGVSHAQPADSPRLKRIEAWVLAVARHQPGVLDDAVSAIRGWSRGELDELQVHLRSVIRLMHSPGTSTFATPVDLRRPSPAPRPIVYSRPELEALRRVARFAASRGDGNQLLRRGAMLHTDIANLAPPDAVPIDDRGAADLQQRTIQLADGRTIGVRDAVGHWEMARRLLDGIASHPDDAQGDPARDPFVKAWYGALGRFMLLNRKLWIPHFDSGLELFPRDPNLLFLSASLHESLAAPRIQDAMRETDFPRVGVGLLGKPFVYDSGVRSRGAELRLAEDQFRRAVDADPAFTEARVRRGRVLTLLDRPTEAVKELRAAVAAGGVRIVGYYAALFLGRAAEAAQDLRLARESYEAAALLYPRAQSPRLALNQIEQDARVVPALHGVLTAAAADARDDPWWSYHIAAGRDADAAFKQLHAMLLAGDRP